MAGQTIVKPRSEKRQRYVFYLGVLLAAIAAIIAFVAVSGADSGGGDTVPVVQAKEAIPADTRITSDMLEVKFMDRDKADGDAFESRSALVDRVAAEDIGEGAQVLTSHVSDVAGDSISFKVERGYRGMSVEVQEVVTAGGNIRPGDQVDMVGVFEVSSVVKANHVLQQLGLDYKVSLPPAVEQEITETEGGETVMVLTVTLLQDVKVLGLDQTLTETTAGGTFAEEVEEAEAEPRASTATLQVKPAKAQMLTTADEYGVLRMDSRAVNDRAIINVQPTLIIVENA